MTRTPLALALAALFCAAPAAHAADTITGINKLWTYTHVGQTSEIPAFDASRNELWVVGMTGIDVLDALSGAKLGHVDTSLLGSANSVTIKNGLAAVAIENSSDRTLPGVVALYDTGSRALTSGINTITVGALPDMLTFTPDGSRLVVANEATPTTYGAYDPAGSVSIIDMGARTATTVSLAGVATSGAGLRTNTGMDFEPEYIAVNAAGTKAYVTLQEANGIATLDLTTGSFSSIVGLGTKDFSLAQNAIDPNHKDNKKELRPANVRGFYQPDAIAAYQAGGNTYLVMANEGDTREDDGDKKRAKDAGLSGVPADLKELNISTTDSTSGANLTTFGGRSFSIRDEAGNIVFDSGSRLDAEAIARNIYDDGRSDDKGVEPEGVSLMTLGGRTFAFIGLERTLKSAVAVYDITDPANAAFVDMIVTDGDLAPEGLTGYSIGGMHYLAVSNEVSGTTSVFQITAVPEPTTYAMLLAGLGMLGFAARRRA